MKLFKRDLIAAIAVVLFSWCPVNADTLPLLGVGVSGAPFTPASLPDLAIWLDASDHTTTFVNTTCTSTTVSASGTAVGSWLDKSTNGFCFVASSATVLILTDDGSGNWYLKFDGTNYFSSGSATNLSLSASYLNSVVGVYYPTAGPQYAFFYATGTSATSARFSCGYDASGNTGEGIGMRVRRLDADAGTNLEEGTDTGYTATRLAQNCDMEYASGLGQLNFNNGSYITNSSLTTAGATSATQSGNGTFVGINGLGGSLILLANTRVYQVVARVPTSSPSAPSQINTETYVCAKMGISC